MTGPDAGEAPHRLRPADNGQPGTGGTVFEVDEDRAVAALELAWADSGYHSFSADGGIWSAISSAGDVLMGNTPEALTEKIRAHWQAMQ